MPTDWNETPVQRLAAWRTQRGCENLISSMLAVPEDKRDWKPLGAGQAVHDILVECILVNLKWALTLQNRAYTRVSPEIVESLHAAERASDELADRLRQSATELIAAIESLGNDELTRVIETPFGSYSLDDCSLIAFWNAAYHEGQINYIQTLYGDQERHTAF